MPKPILGFILLDHSQALKVLNEIANCLPEILGNATEISLHNKDTQNCSITVRNNLYADQKEKLLAHFNKSKVQITERSSGCWIIF
ncbi:MAG: hypothetical protein ACFCUE_14025 [Candidatus Bathyarchaeia archaeon]